MYWRRAPATHSWRSISIDKVAVGVIVTHPNPIQFAGGPRPSPILVPRLHFILVSAPHLRWHTVKLNDLIYNERGFQFQFQDVHTHNIRNGTSTTLLHPINYRDCAFLIAHDIQTMGKSLCSVLLLKGVGGSLFRPPNAKTFPCHQQQQSSSVASNSKSGWWEIMRFIINDIQLNHRANKKRT